MTNTPSVQVPISQSAVPTSARVAFSAYRLPALMWIAAQRAVSLHQVLFRFWVLDGNAGGKRGSIVTQKLALTLRPIRADAPGRPATISGAALPGEE